MAALTRLLKCNAVFLSALEKENMSMCQVHELLHDVVTQVREAAVRCLGRWWIFSTCLYASYFLGAMEEVATTGQSGRVRQAACFALDTLVAARKEMLLLDLVGIAQHGQHFGGLFYSPNAGIETHFLLTCGDNELLTDCLIKTPVFSAHCAAARAALVVRANATGGMGGYVKAREWSVAEDLRQQSGIRDSGLHLSHIVNVNGLDG